MVEFDKILEEIGDISKTQWKQIFILMIPCSMVAMQMGGIIFIGAEVKKECNFPGRTQLTEECNRTWTREQTKKYLPWDSKEKELSTCVRYNLSTNSQRQNCSFWWQPIDNSTENLTSYETNQTTTVPCTSWIYDRTQFTSTVVTDFDLVCAESYKSRFSQSIYMFGVTLGCTFWGTISDRFGRKTAIQLTTLIGSIFAVAASFASSYPLFVVIRALSGFCLFSLFTISFVLATEMVAPHHRVRLGQSCQAAYAVGFCLLALFGWNIREWWKLQLSLSIPLFGLLSLRWLITESPRWLISNKRYEEANLIVQKMLKNVEIKKDMEEVTELEQAANGNIEKKNDGTEVRRKPRHSPLALIRTPNMRSKTIKMSYCWFVCSCVYYGLTFNAVDLGGDPFINLLISGFVEIPAVYFCIPMIERWGRRPSLSFSLTVSGCACIGMLFTPDGSKFLWLNITLSMIGKFSIAAAFGTVYIYTAELIPTPIRNVGLGLCSTSARIGGIVAPFIAMLSTCAKPLPYVVFGTISIVGGVISLFLPEVLGIRLPETIEEGEEFGLNQTGPLTVIYKKLCCREENENNFTNAQLPNVEYKAAARANGSKSEENKL